MVTPGATIGGRYRLDERIASGGMGDVWRGTDEVLGRTVAIKILLSSLMSEPGFAERFRGEARTMATINHPGVVDIYDYGSDEAVGAYLIMEYVEGDALSRTLSRVGRLTPARTMALVAQAADALQAAHDKGIVHRDVKPGNLLVRPNGTLVLTDFGIARSAMVSQLTQAGAVLGTASYISPEQAAGHGATPRSDVYALGVVAYQCLSGRRPFEGDNPVEIALKHVREHPPPLPQDIPPTVRTLVERAMAKDPSVRYPSAAALAQAARNFSVARASNAGPGMATTPIMPPSSPGPVGATRVPPAAHTSPAAGTRPLPPAAPGSPVGVPATRMMPPPGRATPAGGPVRPGAHPGAAPIPNTAGIPRTAAAGGPAGPPHPDRGRAVVIGLTIGLITVLLVAAGIIAYVIARNAGDPNAAGRVSGSPTRSTTPGQGSDDAGQGAGNGDLGGGNAATRTATPPSATPTLIDVQCERWKGKPVADVSTALQMHFTVRALEQASDKPPGVVLAITPCQAHPGDQITVTYSTGPASKPSSATPTPSQKCGVGSDIGDCASVAPGTKQ